MSARRPSIIKRFLSITFKSESKNQKNTIVIFYGEQIISSQKYFMQIISITGLLPLRFLLIIPNKITSHSIQYSMVRIAALFAFWKFEFFWEWSDHSLSDLDDNIYSYCRYVRTGELGHGTQRRPEIIDDFGIYQRVVGNKINQLVSEGPDTRPTAYTP